MDAPRAGALGRYLDREPLPPFPQLPLSGTRRGGPERGIHARGPGHMVGGGRMGEGADEGIRMSKFLWFSLSPVLPSQQNQKRFKWVKRKNIVERANFYYTI